MSRVWASMVYVPSQKNTVPWNTEHFFLQSHGVSSRFSSTFETSFLSRGTVTFKVQYFRLAVFHIQNAVLMYTVPMCSLWACLPFRMSELLEKRADGVKRFGGCSFCRSITQVPTRKAEGSEHSRELARWLC